MRNINNLNNLNNTQSDKNCNHNPNDKGTTLIKTGKYKMVNPQIVDFFCPCCKKVFQFKRLTSKYEEV